MQLVRHEGELLVGAALVGELIPGRHGVHDLPFPVLRVGIQVDFVGGAGQVHLGRMVGPSPEHNSAPLVIEGEVRNVYLTHRLEDPPGLPVDLAVVSDDSSELSVISVDLLGP